MEPRKDGQNRLAVAGIVMDLLELSAWEAGRVAQAATPEERQAIIRAAKWPIRDQALDSVRHHVSRIQVRGPRNLERLPAGA